MNGRKLRWPTHRQVLTHRFQGLARFLPLHFQRQPAARVSMSRAMSEHFNCMPQNLPGEISFKFMAAPSEI
jgi:hypothetical protein